MTEKIGIIVVHGIGDPAPGDALRNLTDTVANTEDDSNGFASPTFHFSLLEERRLATQAPWQDWKTEFFPMAMRRGTMKFPTEQGAQPELIFAEVFWGSASQLPIGMIGMIQGVIRLFFRSIMIVRAAAAGQTTDGDWLWLRRIFYKVTSLISLLLAGPICAVNVLLFLTLLLYAFFGWSEHSSAAALASIQVSSVAALVVAALVLKIDKRRPQSLFKNLVAPAWWLTIVVPFWWIAFWWTPPKNIEETALLLIHILGLFFLGAAFGLVTAVVSRWTHWLLVEQKGSSSTSSANKAYGPPMTIALFTVMIQFTLWVTVIPSLWKLLLNYSGNQPLPRTLYSKAVETDGLQWIVLFVIMSCGLLSWMWYQKQTQPGRPRSLDQDLLLQNSPRLIVHPLLSVPFALVTLATIAIVLFVGSANLFGTVKPEFVITVLKYLQTEHPWGTIILSLLPLALSLLTGSLQQALDLVNDIINYIDLEEQRDQTKQHTIDEPRPLTREIRPRFRLVLQYLVQTEQIDKLVIVAHSQGSVIAMDELADVKHKEFERLGKQITLITFGSPISHLYQHYFPGKYPHWDHPSHWQHLFQRLVQWRHFFRVDDYIGMELRPIPNALVAFSQEEISLGGHSDYWQDKRFIKKIQGVLVGVVSSKS